MRFAQNTHLLINQLTRFRMAGYSVSWRVLNAKDYGLAQDRRRLFLVGIRSKERLQFEFPEPTHGPDRRFPYRRLRDVIWKFRDAPAGSYDSAPLHWYYLSRNRRRTWSQQATCVVAHWRHVGLHPDSPPLKKLGADSWQFVHSAHKARRFSYFECAELQGFPEPEAFDVCSVKLRFRAIGNAVPPPLFAAIAKKLVKTLKNRS
jgi:DNA (cytosine-5)-methyltransferase 1